MWNYELYIKSMLICEEKIETGEKKPVHFMFEYKKMIEQENYEAAQAITEVLKQYNFDTKDTHIHIRILNT